MAGPDDSRPVARCPRYRLEHVAHPVATEERAQLIVDDMPGGGWLAPVQPGRAPGRHRDFLDGEEGKQIVAFGEHIKAIRLASGLKLEDVAARAGVSVALLSRLERAQAPRSRLFRFELTTTDGYQLPVLTILNPYLKAVWAGK